MLPENHKFRMKKALDSLEGLSIGDALGQSFFIQDDEACQLINIKKTLPPTWYFTDDTIMSISIVETLAKFGYIQQDFLAERFAYRYTQQPDRGYGGTAHRILRNINEGIHWTNASSEVFSGMGSMGNGAAMRAGPIGAYFFDDFERAASEAQASAEVTHAHKDAQAGAIAVAIAASYCSSQECLSTSDFFKTVIQFTPQGETLSRIKRAEQLPKNTQLSILIQRLGNGLELCSFDTVPISLWAAAHNFRSFEEAIWQVLSALGDRDTTCAITGSIVALSSLTTIPKEWTSAKESINLL